MFSDTILEKFDLGPHHIVQPSESIIWVQKWDWNYSNAYQFQRYCLEFLKENPKLKILILCSHDRVFTNGRGLQKPKKGQTLDLIEFKKEDASLLPFPFYQIERGGGLTFHHPGQFVFYPVLRLNPHTLSLSNMIDTILEETKIILTDWGLKDLSTEHQLLGLWKKEQKIASMGIAIERLTTFHGMALNLYRDDEMMKALNQLNPCGLNGSTYASVEDFITLSSTAREDLALSFKKRITNAWQ